MMSERQVPDPRDPASWPLLFTVAEANALLPDIVLDPVSTATDAAVYRAAVQALEARAAQLNSELE